MTFSLINGGRIEFLYVQIKSRQAFVKKTFLTTFFRRMSMLSSVWISVGSSYKSLLTFSTHWVIMLASIRSWKYFFIKNYKAKDTFELLVKITLWFAVVQKGFWNIVNKFDVKSTPNFLLQKIFLVFDSPQKLCCLIYQNHLLYSPSM